VLLNAPAADAEGAGGAFLARERAVCFVPQQRVPLAAFARALGRFRVHEIVFAALVARGTVARVNFPFAACIAIADGNVHGFLD
jgi:hypothetical protein